MPRFLGDGVNQVVARFVAKYIQVHHELTVSSRSAFGFDLHRIGGDNHILVIWAGGGRRDSVNRCDREQ